MAEEISGEDQSILCGLGITALALLLFCGLCFANCQATKAKVLKAIEAGASPAEARYAISGGVLNSSDATLILTRQTKCEEEK